MKSDGLRSDEVVTSGDLAGDLERPLAAVLVEGVGAPGLAAGVVAELVDLEPRGRGAIGRLGVVDLGHVDDDGAEVVPADGLVGAGAVVGLGVHLDEEGVTGWMEVSAFGTGTLRYERHQRTAHLAKASNAARTTDIAGKIGTANAGDGRVVGLIDDVSHRGTARGLEKLIPACECMMCRSRSIHCQPVGRCCGQQPGGRERQRRQRQTSCWWFLG